MGVQDWHSIKSGRGIDLFKKKNMIRAIQKTDDLFFMNYSSSNQCKLIAYMNATTGDVRLSFVAGAQLVSTERNGHLAQDSAQDGTDIPIT